MALLPPSKPRLSADALHQAIAPYVIDRVLYPLIIVGIRGYYRNSLGKPGTNDRGLYDDALFVDSTNVTAAFNGNTDPSVARPGEAVLQPGAYFAHRLDIHHGAKAAYPAVCQREGDVAVLRDGAQQAVKGRVGINIHKGGNRTTEARAVKPFLPISGNRSTNW